MRAPGRGCRLVKMCSPRSSREVRKLYYLNVSGRGSRCQRPSLLIFAAYGCRSSDSRRTRELVGWRRTYSGLKGSRVVGELMRRFRRESLRTCRPAVPTPTHFTFHSLRKAVAAALSEKAGVARDLLGHSSNDIADGHYAKRPGLIVEVAGEATRWGVLGHDAFCGAVLTGRDVPVGRYDSGDNRLLRVPSWLRRRVRRRPVVGLRVNITPATSAFPSCWMTTPIRAVGSIPSRLRPV